MAGTLWKKLAMFSVLFVIAWLCVRYLLPLALPFLFGLLVALAAEPMVEFGGCKLSLPRSAGVGIGVSLTLIFLTSLIWLICSLAVKELGQLAKALPNMQNTAQQGIDLLENWMTGLAARSPDSLQPMLTGGVNSLFEGSSTLLHQASGSAIKAAGNVLSRIPNGLLGFGTTLISAFLISQRLPKIKAHLHTMTSGQLTQTYLPALRSVRKVLGQWLLAELKLSSVTCIILAAGFLLLRIPYAPVWALGVALLDALPVFGTGTVLVPWVMINLLQGNHLRGLGLLSIYGVVSLVRAILEPRIVGNGLGLDPLMTLIFLYIGFRIWGIAGMLAAPILAATVKCVFHEFYRETPQK